MQYPQSPHYGFLSIRYEINSELSANLTCRPFDKPCGRRVSSGVEAIQPDHPDGSVDVHFGPSAPDGTKSSWVPTRSGREFEVMFRFYGRRQPLFDKSWKLPDIQPA
ncbi:DUF1214 domain-containing protein [Nocardia sp. NPDC051981]|uniref:DUF1214 domain-containing protein n=1 Tax=Nocardia sp. NPDC051981 TaxID=3155417 RepID=UPI003419DA57